MIARPPGGQGSRRAVLFLALAAFAFSGCDRPQRTVDTLRQEITAYKAAPNETAEAKIEENLTRLDQQIDRLAADGKTAEASGLRATAANLRADYRAARMARSLKDAQTAIRGIGEAIKDAGESIGDAFKPSPTPPPAPQQP